jgi:Skp family chaperone for outer membrane proteins
VIPRTCEFWDPFKSRDLKGGDYMKQKKKVPSEAIAAGAGAIAGVAIGATAVALSDKKNRQKVANVAKSLKKEATKAAAKMGRDAKTLSKKVERDISVMKKDSDKAVADTKKAMTAASKEYKGASAKGSAAK